MPASAVVAVQAADIASAEVREAADRMGVGQHLQAVSDLTQEIYGGFSDVSVSVNPDFGDTRIVFHCRVNCSVEKSLELDGEWDRRCVEIIPQSPQVYLALAYFNHDRP